MADTVANAGAETRNKLNELIRKLRAQKRQQGQRVQGIPRRPKGDAPFALSFEQQRLWLLDRLDPGSVTYTIPGILHLDGPLDHATLHRTLDTIMERHEVLRTTFDTDDPLQIVAPPASVPLPITDLSATEPSQLDEAAERLAYTVAFEPFDLQQGPLLRAHLVRLGPERHHLILAMHHIIADGWSLGVLVREVATLYTHFSTSDGTAEHGMPPLAVQFGDFALWQREQLDDERLERQLEFWRDQLADIPRLPLPEERGGRADATKRFEGKRVPVALPDTARAALDQLARAHHTTLFVAVLAALTAFLARFTGQDDVTVGTPIAGRHRKELEPLIGFFVNTLVLRTNAEGRPSLADMIDRAKETLHGAQKHQDVPFEKLVETLKPNRDPDEMPFFQVLLVLDPVPLAETRAGGLTLRPAGIDLNISKFDLTLSLVATASGLEGNWVFRTARFARTTVERINDAFRVFLEGALTRPEHPVALAPLITARERARLVTDWSQCKASYPRANPAHEMVAVQAERTPDAVALVHDGATVSYAELVARARRFAHLLRARGVQPETVVGVGLERSVELIVAVLAVFESGAAYLPLDPDDPDDRRRGILADADAHLVITERALAGRFAADDGPELLLTDDVTAEANDAADPLPRVDPRQIAYVIYTSGSTGRPKGVAVSHAALANRLQWVRSVDLDETTCFLQKTTISFDVSIAEIFAPLVSGGRVAIAKPGGQRDADYLVDLILEADVTHTSFPPSLLAVLLDEPRFVNYRGLRSVVTGGETVPAELPNRFYESFPDTVLENRYGPTEATISVTNWICARGVRETSLPIGRPIAHAATYVLDPDLNPVPVGVPGELFLGGPSLARGYLGRPARTATSFIPNPFARAGSDPEDGGPGSCLYRTGDITCWRQDGVLNFVGRVDHQVKIRGFRVELGEIEAALRKHPAVRDLAVIDLPDGETRRLVAYVAPEADADLTIEALQAFLGERLPAHMVPSGFLLLDRLPTSSTGKVDRGALRKLAPTLSEEARDETPPRNETERTLAGIWSELLDVEEPGIHGDFFALGGHSLLAARAVARVRQAFDIDMALRQLFEAPTIAELGQFVDASRAASVDHDSAGSGDDDPIASPLSFAQERLWFLDQLEPGSAYNIAGALRLTGELRVDALAEAFTMVVERHEVLRTRFPVLDGQPSLVVDPPTPIALPITDLRGMTPTVRDRHARLLANEEANRPFDLARDPLLRVTLLRLGDQDWRLVAVLHHIVSDGWSVGVLIREIAAAYGITVADESTPALPSLASLPIQYRDHARAERRALRGARLTTAIEAWRERLRGVPVLELPTDRPRPPRPSGKGALEPLHLDATTRRALEALGQQHDATLFMVLLSAFNAVLARWSGQDDIAVGTPVANRDSVDVEPLIGMFVNTVVLRSDLSGAPTMNDLVARARDVTLDAFGRQAVPFEKLVEALQPTRDLATSPLFQVMLVLQNVPRAALELPALRLEREDLDPGTTKFDLTLSLSSSDEGIVGTLEYSTDLFDPASARRLVRHFETLVATAVDAPDTPIARLPLTSTTEREALLASAVGPRRASTPTTLADAFLGQVARTPEATALVSGPETGSVTWTYAELAAHARAAALGLHDAGLGVEDRIGLCMARGPAFVVGMLATADVGAAYVPLDPDYPTDRLRFMAEDAALGAILIDDHGSVEALALPAALPVITVAVPDRAPALENLDQPLAAVEETNIAYIIYTSGSTGLPKGVAIAHAAAVNHMRWMQRAFPLDVDDAVLHKTPSSFDASVWELWAPLLTGARLVLAAPDAHREPGALLTAIETHDATVLQGVPSLLEVIADEPALETRAASLDRIFSGGEALGVRLARRLHTRTGARVINLYGPTEATIEALSWTCDAADHAAADGLSIPIGKPIDNMRVHALDADLQPAAHGLPGEVYIGGVGLARGYWRRPGLTAERFVPDPWSKEPGARLYRTGDLAHRRMDEALVFGGRADHQVKLRGFRIELGEIEALLVGESSVRTAAVVVHGDTLEDQRLVAFVVPTEPITEDQPLDTDRLVSRLAQRLPAYMVPALIVPLEALPTLPNGKTDRGELARRPVDADWQRAAYVAPDGPTEAAVATIWRELLTVESIGRDDSFFDLGGHSLLATRVVSRVRDHFDVELTLRQLFEHTTVATLAAAIDQSREPSDADDDATRPVAIVPAERGATVPLSFAQERLWFLHVLDPTSPAYHIPAAIQLRGALDAEALRVGLETIVHRHESLRTVYRSEDGSPVSTIAPPTRFTVSIEDLRDLDEATRETRIHEHIGTITRTPFDLEQPPLMRAALLRLRDDTHILVLVLHHIASDGWSVGVLVREFVEAYTAHVEARPSALATLPIQYPDFAAWQRAWLASGEMDRQIDYWRRQLAGSELLELPTDRPRAKRPTTRGHSFPVAIPPPLVTRLEALAKDHDATLYMGLLAVFSTLLSRWSRQDDICVGSPIAGRRRAEIEGLIGFFINTLVLRTRLDGRPSFTELLGQVREVTLDAYAHQDAPFEKLVEAIDPQRGAGATPLFQVMLALQDAPDAHAALPGVTLEPLSLASTTAKFDLLLSFTRRGQGLEGTLEYNLDLFDEATVQSLMRGFVTLLDAALSRPHAALVTLPLMTHEARTPLLGSWAGTTTDYPREASIGALFSERALAAPTSVALTHQGRHLTYGELERHTNRLARHLRELGVERGSAVALCLDRSFDLIVATLATIKAGGYFVPLDPAYPNERLAFMVDDASAAVLVLHEHLRENLPADLPDDLVQVTLNFGGTEDGFGDQFDTPLPDVAGPLDFAYIMYTSGSTGRPKGVVIPHRAVVRLVRDTNFVDFSEDQVFLQFASTAFDAATFEMWGPLLNGARLVVAPPGRVGLDELGALIVAERVDTILLTTGVFNQLIDDHLDCLCGVRHIMSGGEAASAQHMQRAVEGLPDTLVTNVYGPTENATIATFHDLPTVEHLGVPGTPIPIGISIANSQNFVVDDEIALTPPGMAGQLASAGDGLAVGYRGRPALTASVFVPNPHGEPGSRLYLTGDLTRYNNDGTFGFLGRVDRQVKLRGFRIEPGEIETLLATHADVARAVVLVREDESGDRRLVAYVVAEEGASLESDRLREHLLNELPAFMVPAAFVPLETLPLNANGKVDHAALPAPTWRNATVDVVAPETDTERGMVALFVDVLSLDPAETIGIDDDFFGLGGHSLLATKLVSRIRRDFGVELPLAEVFTASTVRALSAAIDAEGAAGHDPEHASPADSAPPMVAIRRENVALDGGLLPVSFAQERLWFLDRFQPGQATYNVPVAARLSGPLDVDAMAGALGLVVARHEALRTVFTESSGTPYQVIQPGGSVPLPLIDLSEVNDLDEAERQLRDATAREAARPFDLATGPILRALLVRLGDERHLLMITMHHIVTDGWSMEILMREIAAAYVSLAADQDPSTALPPLALQYADFSHWQRQWLTGDVLERQLDYWRTTLDGVPALELPTDRPRPAVMTQAGATIPVHLPEEMARRLQALAQDESATLFMALLAAFGALLGRYADQDDFAIGSPIANRNHLETEGMIGFFVNTLALRVDLSQQPTFRELLVQVRDTTLGAYAHQDVPFEKLVEVVEPSRSLSRTPLFQVMFSLQNAATPSTDSLSAAGLTLTPQPIAGETAKFELTLTLAETNDGLDGTIEFNRDLFDQATMRRMVDTFETVLRSALETPDAAIGTLSLLDAPARAQLLGPRAGQRTDYPREASIAELFAEQVQSHPDHVALTFEGRSLTYEGLDERAESLARHLHDLGTRRGSPVALCLDRSFDLIVATVAVLKAGGYFIPLDPSYPNERLAFMLKDTRATALVLHEHLRASLPTPLPDSLAVVSLAQIDAEHAFEAPQGAPLKVPLDATDWAYVMYTSGSTGRPKGVVVPHRAVVRLVKNTNFAQLDAAQVFLQFAPTAFDAATLELWGPLLNGGRLVLAPAGPVGLDALGELIVSERVTTLWLTSGLFTQMVDDHIDSFSGVRQLLTGGDVVSPTHVRRVLEHVPGITVIDGYGPTENTTFTTCHPLKEVADLGAPGEPLPIGQPIANTRIHIVDRDLMLIPAGKVGQLAVAGDGLATGYLNRPAQTAAVFVPNPNGPPGSRLYLTGDLARFRGDGAVAFLGRGDRQVKLRGFRIEPGEIETKLVEHPSVARAVVVVRLDAKGDKRLVGYLVGEGDTEPDVLREHLRVDLPEYMVPTVFIPLDALPLNANGKVDRSALPEPVWHAGSTATIAPRTEAEEQLAALFADVLGLEDVDTIGVDDDFFVLGGHSLLATKLASRIRRDYGVEIPLPQIFLTPTVGALATAIGDETSNGAQGETIATAPPIVPLALEGNREEHPHPLSFAQERMLFLDRLQPGNAAYHVPVAVRLSGPLDTDAMAEALHFVVQRHESLRTVFADADDQPQQWIQSNIAVPMPLVDLRDCNDHAAEAAQEQLLIEEASRPFDLAQGPLLRATLVQRTDESHVLMLTMHHIVTDGWSMEILVREVAAAYVSLAADQDPSTALPPLTLQYADFSHWQRQWLTGDVLERQLDYWQTALEGVPALELPTDRPRPAVVTQAGATVPVHLPKEVARRLQALTQDESATLFMALLAAFGALLGRYADQDDFAIGSPIANRNRLETEGMIGFFVNTLALRVDLSQQPTFRELLVQVRDTTLGAYAHQDVPFEKLVEVVEPTRSLSRTPLFQVMFSLQNAATPSTDSLSAAGLTLTPQPIAGETAKFEVTLTLAETNDGLDGTIEFNRDLFDVATMDRLAEHYAVLLDAATTAPDQPIGHVDLLTENEWRTVLGPWSRGPGGFPTGPDAVTRFREEAARAPEQPAVTTPDQTLTFRALAERIERLAHRLQELDS